VLPVSRVAVHGMTGEAVRLENVPVGAFVALHAENGETLALGVVEAIDDGAGTLTVRTTRTPAEIAAVTVGETMAT
jgi:polynucleotide 5'-kinase involved in rRNA processing